MRHHIETARAALLLIWPKGRECEHMHAREAFVALDEAAIDQESRCCACGGTTVDGRCLWCERYDALREKWDAMVSHDRGDCGIERAHRALANHRDEPALCVSIDEVRLVVRAARGDI